MKKIFLLLFLVSVLGTLNLFADSSQSFKIDEQTGVFSARFTAVPSATNLNGAVGFGGNEVAAWGDFNCILRFGEDNKLQAFNAGVGYTAEEELIYVANRRYYVQMDIDVPNSLYSVKVTPFGGNTVVLAKDYAFRNDQVTGAINYMSTRIVDLEASIGVLDFQIGSETIETNHYNFNTQIDPQTGDFAMKVAVTPSSDNMNGAFGLSSMSVAAWNNFNAILQFNTNGEIKAYNRIGYDAITVIPYIGGERYLFFITGSTVTKTYSVDVVSPDGSVATLATDYGFRLNGPVEADGEKVEFIGQRIVHDIGQGGIPGSYIAIDGVELGSLGMDGVNPAFVQAIAPEAGVFSKEFVVVPSVDVVDAAIAFNETDAVSWGEMSAMISFNTAGLIKVRNGGSYESLVDVPYKALGAYHFKVDFDVVNDTYSVSVRTSPHEAAIVLATDYSFRTPATALNFMTTKSTWDIAFGVPGGYLIVNQAAISASIQVGNNPPTINPVENFNFFITEGSATRELTGISDGDGGSQTLTLTASSSAESVVTVAISNFTSVGSTADLVLTAASIGQATITIKVNDGEDETIETFVVEVLEWSSIRDVTIRANEGDLGAVNRVLTGQQNDGAYYEQWLTTNTGGAKMVNDNLIINRPDRFIYTMYIRFDLNSLPETGVASNGKFQIFTEPKDYDRDSVVLYVLEDMYFPQQDYQGFDFKELDELYIEGDAGGWIRVYEGNTGNFLPGYKDWITSDNAPGFNEGNLIDLGPGWNVYDETVLQRIGDMHTVLAGEDVFTIEHQDIAKHINEDSNGALVFVLGKLAQNSWAQRVEVYSNHDLGKEPRISFTWDDQTSIGAIASENGSSVNVFPNPVKNSLNYAGAENMDKATIYNIQGQVVLETIVKNSASIIDVSFLNKGIYLIEFSSQNNGSISRSKFVVK